MGGMMGRPSQTMTSTAMINFMVRDFFFAAGVVGLGQGSPGSMGMMGGGGMGGGMMGGGMHGRWHDGRRHAGAAMTACQHG